MLRQIRALTRSTTGASAVEFAVILPVLLVFLAGVVEIGRIFLVYNTVNRLATRYAIAYADCSQYNSCTAEQGYYGSAVAQKNIAPQLTNPVTVRLFVVSISASGTVTVASSPAPYPSSATMTSTETSSAATNITKPGYPAGGVVVTVSYTHSLVFFATLIQRIAPSINTLLTVSYTVAQRSG